MITATATLTETISVTASLAVFLLPPVIYPIRYNYTPSLFYIGFGATGATDSAIITIKRVTVDLSDGSIIEEYSTNPWTNFADGPWSPTP
jgi:hypothetical protein